MYSPVGAPQVKPGGVRGFTSGMIKEHPDLINLNLAHAHSGVLVDVDVAEVPSPPKETLWPGETRRNNC